MYVHQAFGQRLGQYGISVVQWCILVAFISRVVGHLIAADLVDQTAGKDHRSGHLQLTDDGRQLIPLLIKEAEKNGEGIFGDLTPEERGQLQFLLKKLLIKHPATTLDGWTNEGNFMTTDTIADTLKQAKENRWPYPKTFQLLKEAGVTSYRVKWGEKYEGVYQGTFGEWKEPPPRGFKPIKRGKTAFSAQGVKNALNRHQRGETDFVTLLDELAEAGVSHYVVDMDKRMITYYDAQEKEYCQERVPNP
jgi:hypothetical protein